MDRENVADRPLSKLGSSRLPTSLCARNGCNKLMEISEIASILSQRRRGRASDAGGPLRSPKNPMGEGFESGSVAATWGRGRGVVENELRSGRSILAPLRRVIRPH